MWEVLSDLGRKNQVCSLKFFDYRFLHSLSAFWLLGLKTLAAVLLPQLILPRSLRHSLASVMSETLLELWVFRLSGKFPWDNREFL